MSTDKKLYLCAGCGQAISEVWYTIHRPIEGKPVLRYCTWDCLANHVASLHIYHQVPA